MVDSLSGEALGQIYDDIANRAIQHVLDAHEDMRPPVVNHLFYGATDIHPRHLVIWLAFADTPALQEAEKRGHCRLLRREIRAALRKGGYPAEVLSKIHIGFVSEQEVEEAGGPWIYFH
jgi:hypothetical protein